MSNSSSGCACPRRVSRRIHRHSGSVVFLGHALLLPALLVTIFGSMGIVGFRSAPPPTASTAQASSARLEAAGVPPQVIEEISAHRPLTQVELEALTPDQHLRVLEAQVAAAGQGARNSMASFTSSNGFRLLVAGSAACAAVGCLLVRKRTVARCTSCGAIHDPSSEVTHPGH